MRPKRKAHRIIFYDSQYNYVTCPAEWHVSILAKRAQEMLMFGNQQNRQPEKKPSASYTSTAEKSEYLVLNNKHQF